MFVLNDNSKDQGIEIESATVLSSAHSFHLADTWMKPLYCEKSCDLPILIYFPTLIQLWEYALAKPNGTNAGILTGGLNNDGNGVYIVVTGFMEAQFSNDKSHRLTFLDRSWTYIDKQVFTNNFAKRCVGSFHAHSGQGVYLSRQDLSIYKRFSSGEGQIALVLDPPRNDYGIYYQHDAKMLASRNVHVFSNSKQNLNDNITCFINKIKANGSKVSIKKDEVLDQDRKPFPTFLQKMEGLLFIDALINETNKGKQIIAEAHMDLNTLMVNENQQILLLHNEETPNSPETDMQAVNPFYEETVPAQAELVVFPTDQILNLITYPQIEGGQQITPDISVPQCKLDNTDIIYSVSEENQLNNKGIMHDAWKDVRPVHTFDIRVADDLHFDQAFEQVTGIINAKLDELMNRTYRRWSL